MKRAVIIAGAAVALAGMLQRASAQTTVSACTGNCAQVSVTPSSVTASPMATVGLTFKQAANDGQAGGPDEIAALALTMTLGSGSALLLLNDCTLNADGLPAAVKPDASISNFKVVVENASCANGRTHCLCPDSGAITPDNFINLVVYGPNPLPTPGTGTIDIPTLPAGPQQLLTIDLKGASGASGTAALHLYNQVSDTSHPQFTALLSLGDKAAVDQTCVPVSGQPPCSGNAASQVATIDGSVVIPPITPPCAGDCDASGDVTVNEIIILVNIDLGSAPPSACPSGIPSGVDVDIALIIKAVNNALGSCPTS